MGVKSRLLPLSLLAGIIMLFNSLFSPAEHLEKSDGLNITGESQSTLPSMRGANVVLITIESLRPDHMGAYGYGRNTTPYLDRLSRDSLVFENAYANSPWTLPSLATLMTSLYPSQHGLNDIDKALSTESVGTLSGLLVGDGYRTYAGAHVIFDIKGPGLLYEFQKYYLLTGYPEVGNSSIPLNNALKGVISKEGRPFLLWVHYFEPHFHYNPSPPYDRMFSKNINALEFFKHKNSVYCAEKGFNEEELPYFEALYDGEIALVDHSIEEFMGYMESQGLLNNTVVIVTSDHGEEFNDHGGCDHGRTLYDEVLHVPLLMHVPSAEPGRVGTQVSLIDLAPTILDLLEVRSPAMGGRSLMPLIRGEAMADEPVFSESLLYGSQRKSVRFNGLKLIYDTKNGSYELYNLSSDPQEKTDIYAQNASSGDLERMLREWMRNATLKGPEKKVLLSEEAKERLRAAGYVM